MDFWTRLDHFWQAASVAIPIMWALLAWVGRWKKLPAPVANAIKAISSEQIVAWIAEARRLSSSASDADRRAFVAEKVKQWWKARNDFPLPDSVVDLVVQWVYTKVFKGK